MQMIRFKHYNRKNIITVTPLKIRKSIGKFVRWKARTSGTKALTQSYTVRIRRKCQLISWTTRLIVAYFGTRKRYYVQCSIYRTPLSESERIYINRS